MWLKLAAEGIPTKDLAVSFNQMYRAYLLYYPGTNNKYVTNIAGTEFGMGPRYLLEKKLKEVKKSYPVTVPINVIQAEPIEELKRPLKVLLGKKRYLRVHDTDAIQDTVSTGDQSNKDDGTRPHTNTMQRVNEHEVIHSTEV